jgi:hypothetical protein
MWNPFRSEARPAHEAFDSLCLFTFFWAVAILTHQGYHGQFNANWHDALLIVAACAALLRPSSITRLAALMAAAVVAIAVEMPDVYNHWLLVGLASAVVLVVLATRPRRASGQMWDREAIYHALAPPLRLMLLGTYAFAFLAKLNPGFLHPNVSCAAVTYPRLAGRLTILPLGDWARHASIWFTLIMEAAIPLLLALRRTRTSAVFVALAFHATMGLAAFYDFSAAAAGFLVLFLPDDTPARLTDLARRRPWLGRAGGGNAWFARMPISLPIVVGAGYAIFSRIRLIETPFAFSMRLWIVFTVGVFAVFVLALIGRRAVAPARTARLTLAGRLWLFGALLVILDTASPPLAFSIIAAALLTALVPADAPQELASFVSRPPALARLVAGLEAFRRGPAATLAVFAAGYLLMSHARHWPSPLYFVLLGMAGWASARLLLAVLRETRNAPVASHLRGRHPAYLLGPLLILVNGLSPYVGLKTEHSFTMFSNLMTEGDRWNHFLLPRAMKVFPLQDDLVQVVRSSDQRFRQFAERRTQLVWVHFQSLVSRYPHIRITYERAGQRYEVARVGDDPILSKRPDWVVAKLMDFRTIPRRNVCRH